MICGKHLSVGATCSACEAEGRARVQVVSAVPPLWLKAVEHLAEALGHLKAAHVFSQPDRKNIDNVSTVQVLDHDGDVLILENRIEQTIAKFSLEIAKERRA